MTSPEEFFDVWADLYDANHGERAVGDREFYVDLAREADGPVLEVGCGTGRIYLELLDAGVDAYGIDVSREMLDVLDEKARERGLAPQVRRADMAAFEPRREFSLVVVPFRTFLHNLTAEARQAALRNFRRALGPDGRLALNFFAPDFEVVCETYGRPQTTVVEHEDAEYEVTDVSEIVDEVEQVVETTRRIRRDGEVIREASFRVALVSKSEFELLLETTGWSDWAVYGGFDRASLGDAARELVWVVEK